MQTIVGLIVIFVICIAIMFGARYMFMKTIDKSLREKREKEEKKEE